MKVIKVLGLQMFDSDMRVCGSPLSYHHKCCFVFVLTKTKLEVAPVVYLSHVLPGHFMLFYTVLYKWHSLS